MQSIVSSSPVSSAAPRGLFSRSWALFFVLALLPLSAQAATKYWVGTTTTWAVATNWRDAATGATGIPATTDDVVFANSFTFGGTTYTATTHQPSGISQTANSVTFESGTDWQLTGSGNTFTNTSGNITVNAGAVGQINNFIASANGLTKLGLGTFIQYKVGTYTGATTVSAGTLRLGGPNNLSGASSASFGTPSTSAVSVASGATYDLDSLSGTIPGLTGLGTVTNGGTLAVSTAGTSTFDGVISGASTALTKSGTGTFTLTGANTYGGVTTVSAGTLQIGNGSTTGTLGSGNVSNAATLTFNRSDAVSISNIISGVGTLIKTGAGTTTLNSANTYTGTTTITNGKLVLGVANALSATTPVVIGNNSAATDSILDLNGLNTTLYSIATPSLFAGANAYIENDGIGNKNLIVNGAVNTTWGGIMRDNDGAGGHTGTLNFETSKAAGNSTLTLTNHNTYSGTTKITLTGGTVCKIQIGINNALPISDVIMSGLGGSNYASLDLGGFNQEIGSLTGNVGCFIGNSVAATTKTLTVNTSSTTTYVGTMYDNFGGKFALAKDGPGIFILGTSTVLTNSYTGPTTIKNGTLRLSGTGGWPSGAASDLTVGTAATLAGTPAIFDLNSQSITTPSLTGIATSAYIENDATGATTTSTVTVAATSNTSYNGALRDNNGTGGLLGKVALTKSGTFTLTLAGANVNSGTTSVTGGKLLQGAASAFSPNAAFSVGNGAVSSILDLGGFDTTLASLTSPATVGVTGYVENDNGGLNTLTLNGTSTFYGILRDNNGTGGSLGLQLANANTLTVVGANTYSGPTTITSGTLLSAAANVFSANSVITLGSSTAATSGNLTLNGFSQTIGGLNHPTLFAGSNAYVQNNSFLNTAATLTSNNNFDSTFYGIFRDNSNGQTGTLSFIKGGTGTMTLGGTGHTLTGGLGVNNGKMVQGVTGAFPTTCIITVGNASTATTSIVDLNGFDTTVAALASPTLASGASAFIENDGSGTKTLTLGGTLSPTATFGGIIRDKGPSGTTGALNLSLNKSAGFVTQTLSGANTYSGTTDLTVTSTGVVYLYLGRNNALPTTTALSMSGVSSTYCPVFFMNGFDQTVASLSGSGPMAAAYIKNFGVSQAGTATLTVNTSASTQFNGNIGNFTFGVLNITKSGSGTLTLNTSSGYSGTTTITNGTLKMGAATSLTSTTPVVMGDGAGGSTAILDLNTFSPSLASLSCVAADVGKAFVENDGAGTSTLTVNGTYPSTFYGTIRDNGNAGVGKVTFVKSGTQDFNLGGTISCTGPNGGYFNSSVAIIGGNLNVQSSGAITGIGNNAANDSVFLLGGTLTGLGSVKNIQGGNSGLMGAITPGTNGIGTLTLTDTISTNVLQFGGYTANGVGGTTLNSTLGSQSAFDSLTNPNKKAIAGTYGQLLIPSGNSKVILTAFANRILNLSLDTGFNAPRGAKFAIIRHAGSGALTVNGSFSAPYTNGSTFTLGGKSFTINYPANFDGDGNSNDVVVTSNDGNAPVVTPATGTIDFTESANAVAPLTDGVTLLPENNLAVSDLDGDNITGAVIIISTGFETTKDALEYTTTNGITGGFVDNGTTGILTLSGNKTAAEYLQALQAIKFRNNSERPTAGPRTVSIVVTDSTSASSTSVSRTVTVYETNDLPVASAQSVSTNDNTAKSITLSATDRDDSPLTYKITALPTHGTLSVGGTDITSASLGSPYTIPSNGAGVLYTPATNYAGSDSFKFLAFDSRANSSEATVSITVVDTNQAPTWTTAPQSDNIAPGGTSNQTVLATDADNDPLTYSVVSVVSGSETALVSGASFNAGTRTFTFSTSTQGTYTFRFKVSDGRGGLLQSDISIVVATVGNSAPTISSIAPQSTNEDTTLSGITFSVGDTQTPASSLNVTVSSSNPTLVPNDLLNNLILGGSGASRTLSIVPADDKNGTATITVTVDDGSLSATSSFTLTVNAVNDVPSFSLGSSPAINEKSSAQVQTVTGIATSIKAGPTTATDEAGQGLSFVISNDTNGLFSVQPAIDANGDLTYTPAPYQNGSVVVTVALKDDNGTPGVTSDDQTSSTQSFTITINAVNNAPSFTVGASQTVAQNSGPQSVSSFLTNIKPGPAAATDEAGQTVSFVVSNNSTSLFSVQPTIAANGTLTFQAAPGASGTATVSVYALDNGSATAPNVNQSAAQTFTITVSAGPAIYDFDPDFGQNGSYVVISGSGFSVSGGGKPTVTMGDGLGGSVTVPAANITVDSDRQLTVLIPGTVRTGKISVTNGFTTTFPTEFVVIPKFADTNPFPASGAPLSSITITGKAFKVYNATGDATADALVYGGVTRVRFSAPNAGFIDGTITGRTGPDGSNNETLTVTVPDGAIDGPIRLVYTRGGSSANVTSSTNFGVSAPTGPAITSFGPTSGPVGSRVKIYGRGFTNATAVQFVGSGATVIFNVISATQINATVPNIPLGSYILSVTKGTTADTTALTPNKFTVTRAPLINSFTPSQGIVDDAIALIGANFTTTSDVQFAASPDGTFVSTGFVANSSTSMTVFVPDGAKTGYIKVINPFGSYITTVEFIVKPQVFSFTPVTCSLAQISSGQIVTITGQSFKSLVKKVKFGVTGSFGGLSVGAKYDAATFATATDGFVVDSDTQIRARVPQGLAVGAGKIRLNYQAGLDALTAPTQQADSTQDFTVTATKPALGGSAGASSARRQ